MIKRQKSCSVCKAILGNKVLTNAIYNTSYYMKSSGTSLAQLQEDYKDKFSYASLLNHVKKHQFVSAEDYSERHLRKIAKDAEKQILKQTIASTEVWNEVIDQGMVKLQQGELTMRTSDLLKAAKDKSDYEFKQKDQQLAMMDMVFHFSSGESERGNSAKYDRKLVDGEAVEDFDPTAELTEDTGAGQDRPSDIHYPPAWDAATQGTS